jgi:hypothetical protein
LSLLDVGKQMPPVPGPWPSAAQAVGKTPAEFLAPAPNSLIGDDNATFSQEQLDIPQAKAEHMEQPDSMSDDLGGKAMALVRVKRSPIAAGVAGQLPLRGV